MRRVKASAALAFLAILCGAAMVVSTGVGAAWLPPDEVADLVWDRLSGSGTEGVAAYVLFDLRMPRVLFAAVTGACLAVSGALLQGLFRNPLADPGLVGVSAGAALGAVAAIVGAGLLSLPASALGGGLLVSGAALLGAWGASWAVFRLGTSGRHASVATLLLAGIAINALAGSIIGICTFLADDEQLRTLNFWMLGSLGRASWETLGLLAPFALVLAVFTPGTARALNALALGESEALHLGVDPERLKRRIVLLTSLAVGACVAQTGMIAFLGLVVPHLVRLVIGPDHVHVLPCSALLGALLLVLADALARTVVAPAEMPIGILTTAVGAPFFLWLVRHRTKSLFAA